MRRAIILLTISLGFASHAGPFFKSTNQLEIRKYRFSPHPLKGFERLVLEFDHLASDGSRPTLKVEPGNNEARISLSEVQLSGVIPESEINRSYLTHSRFLGPVTLSADRGVFKLVTALKKEAVVEAFWLDKPARLVVDVYGDGSVSKAPAPDRKLATKKKPTTDVFCFPTSSQIQPQVVFKIDKDNENSGAGDTLNGNEGVVCFPSGSRLTPKISYRLSTVPTYPVPPSQSTSKTEIPGIQTDMVGGSQKVETVPTTPLSSEASSIPPAPTIVSIPIIEGPSPATPPEAVPVEPPLAAQIQPEGPVPASLSNVSGVPAPAQPSDVPLTDGTVPSTHEGLPTTDSEVTQPPPAPIAENAVIQDTPQQAQEPFPVKKKKKKKLKPRLPQLPLSITEGALLPPMK